MHNFDPIFSKFLGGGAALHLRERVTPSPILTLSELRTTVKHSVSSLRHTLTSTRISTFKFGENPCDNKEMESNCYSQLDFLSTRTRTTTFSDHITSRPAHVTSENDKMVVIE